MWMCYIQIWFSAEFGENFYDRFYVQKLNFWAKFFYTNSKSLENSEILSDRKIGSFFGAITNFFTIFTHKKFPITPKNCDLLIIRY